MLLIDLASNRWHHQQMKLRAKWEYDTWSFATIDGNLHAVIYAENMQRLAKKLIWFEPYRKSERDWALKMYQALTDRRAAIFAGEGGRMRAVVAVYDVELFDKSVQVTVGKKLCDLVEIAEPYSPSGSE